jgi:hypothetical protein
MSVAPLTAQELGCFAAIAHKHLQAGPLADLCELAHQASHGNAAAYTAQYGDPMEPEAIEDIEAAALDYLAERRDMVADHFGPIAYNMIENDGTAYAAPGVQISQGHTLIATINEIEDRARKWQDGEHRKMKRAEENAEAFNEVGQLPVLTKAEIEAKMKAAGAERIIIASFMVNESDSYTDYHGGRTGRTVVIGFGKGKRESFRQLRAAAGKFPPTAHMGPGKDIYKPRVLQLDDVVSNGSGHWKGSYSHWHRELQQDDHGHDVDFSTEAEALAWIAKKGAPEPIQFNTGKPEEKLVRFGWDIIHSSYEQRENYSMGGGNYLGTSRYGGWKVTSRSGTYAVTDRCEVFLA